MLTLYFQHGCPFCAKALQAIDELGLTVTKKDVEDFMIKQELIARGGKAQVPYLIDDEAGVEMYESDAIVDYLHEHFGKEKVSSSEAEESQQSCNLA